MCTVTGWGTTSEGGSLARVLQKVSVPVVSDDDCRDAYGSSQIADSMICAGLDAGGKDSCQVKFIFLPLYYKGGFKAVYIKHSLSNLHSTQYMSQY